MSRREEIAEIRQAAFDGVPDAQYELGCAYAEGLGVPRNPRTALRWFLKSAEQGHAEAQTAVGYCYLNGEGTAGDDDQAVLWLRRALESGSTDARRYLTGCRIYGQGMPAEFEAGLAEAEELFASTEDPEYAYLLACAWSDLRDDESRAQSWHERAAALGHDESMVWMGYYHRYGIGVPRDLKLAFEWYQRAAEAGNEAGLENIAVCYQHGEGVPQDLELAYDYRRQAAERGFSVSRRWLGKHLIHGAGVAADPARGISMLEALADEDAAACMMLGEVYYYGEGVDSDLDRATHWFERAAQGTCPKRGRSWARWPSTAKVATKTRNSPNASTAKPPSGMSPRPCTTSRGCSKSAAKKLWPSNTSNAPLAWATAPRPVCLPSAAWRPNRRSSIAPWNGSSPPWPKRIPTRCSCAPKCCATASAESPTCARRWSCSIWRRSRDAIRAWSGGVAAEMRGM
ncbi:MAG: SEL1-like repeat protein [Planctomycetota bacterium]